MPSTRRKYDPALPRLCALPGCGNTFTGHGSKRYCSVSCSHRYHRNQPHYKRPTNEQQKGYRLKKYKELVEAMPPCSICGKTTARKSVYSQKTLALSPVHEWVPSGINLCRNHFKGFGSFIQQNGYENEDMEQVFAAYLVRLTFTNTDRVPLMKMMRDAIKSKTPDRSALRDYNDVTAKGD